MLFSAATSITTKQKTRLKAGFLFGETGEVKIGLLQLCFFIHHMFPSFRIKFHDLHFLGHGAFVFAGGVEMTGASSGFEFDFIAHDFSFGLVLVGLDCDALSAQIG